MEATILTFLIFILLLAIFLGFEIISRAPSSLHTPLLSGTNAVSGVTVLGAMLAAGMAKGIGNNDFAALMGGIAVALAAMNISGGYLLTHRILEKFRKKEPDEPWN